MLLLIKIGVLDSGRESIGGEEGEGRGNLLRKQERNLKNCEQVEGIYICTYIERQKNFGMGGGPIFRVFVDTFWPVLPCGR